MAVPFDVTSASPMELLGIIGEACEIVWVVDMADPSLGPLARLLPRTGRVVDVHGQTARQIGAHFKSGSIDGVIAFADSQLLVASAVAEATGLPHNPSCVVERLNDKFVQRAALAAAGIQVPGYRDVPHGASPRELAALFEGLAFPVVVKPRHGVSSREVRSVATMEDLIDLLRAGRSGPDLTAEQFIVEERLAGEPSTGEGLVGDYVSVEMISGGGVPVPLAVTGKFPLAPPFRETGNFMPHLLGPDEASRVVDLALAATMALGVREGALHVEIKLTPDGPRIIEVNGRVGGGGIDALFARRRGCRLTELAVRSALGEHLDPASLRMPEPDRFDFEFFVQPPMEARRLESLRGTQELTSIAGVDSVLVNRAVGDELSWQSGSQGFLVQVGGTASDRERLLSMPETILGALDLVFAYGAHRPGE